MSFNAHGSTFSIGGTLVGDLDNIGLPERTRAEIEMTDHDSDGDREFIPGLRDGGSVTLEGNLAPGNSGQIAIEDNYAGNVAEECVITLPTTPATTYTFDGFVTALGGGLPFDDKGTYSVTVKVSGPVTVETAAS